MTVAQTKQEDFESQLSTAQVKTEGSAREVLSLLFDVRFEVPLPHYEVYGEYYDRNI